MISDSIRSEFEMQTRVMLVVAAAMPVGSAFFGVVVCAIADWGALKNFQAIGVFQLVGILFGFIAFTASFIVPAAIRRSRVRQVSEQFGNHDSKASGKSTEAMNENRSLVQRLLAIFQTTLIIRLAVIEGAIFLNFAMFMIETHPVNLGVGIFGLLLLLMLLPFPMRIWGWVESITDDMQFHARGR